MARNKYPEETRKKILEVSLQLFLERGYEHSSIQDIVDHLGGLSKGAIYHHFKSKDEILVGVMDYLYETHDSDWDDIKASGQNSNGWEKLRMLFEASIFNSRQDEMFGMAPDFLKNPQMLALQLHSIFTESAPKYVQPIIEEGIRDGSIKTEYPRELAELLLLLINIWLTPMVYYAGPEVMENRIGLFRQVLDHLGINIFSEESVDRLLKFCQLYSAKNHLPD